MAADYLRRLERLEAVSNSPRATDHFTEEQNTLIAAAMWWQAIARKLAPPGQITYDERAVLVRELCRLYNDARLYPLDAEWTPKYWEECYRCYLLLEAPQT